jgi:hypothetical protein
MKARELLNKWPMVFLVWNLNEDTNTFWSDMATLEENSDGTLLDPWGQRISLLSATKKRNAYNDITEFHITSEFQGYPTTLIILNE